ncbi:hypothetical protein EIP91_001233 [Steccherinum ochraceum]|uniref:Major facilitator superfamily (MFS) profile domain-containing protein n=1 Tax=Steccherinum ochraceum TaxID=92696 RepID=A0A4R0RKU4_9APHY|nr:hypothetical protein EIP91_001233 [Steccherinum ochraceum]
MSGSSNLEKKQAEHVEMRETSRSSRSSSDSMNHKQHRNNVGRNVNAKLANPLAGIPQGRLMDDASKFAEERNLGHLKDVFRKGALVAQDPTMFESLEILDENDKNVLRRELTHRWDQPFQLYYLVILCSLAAAVQGMDEAVINGANLFFAPQFGIPQNSGDTGRNQWLLGLVNSAPYHLFVARFILGFGIGPKSTTVPVYAAECAPPVIRGALVMMWQMWTAFGIMLGYVMDLAFFHVPNTKNITGLNWRLMLASAGVPALFIMSQVFFCPESPRWLMSKGRYDKAYESLLRLRNSPLQAARDLYYIHTLLKVEEDMARGHSRVVELFTVPRNRRAALASAIVMFMQQFCGINVLAYYSSSIFSQANLSDIQALLASFGLGVINWVFAFPAVYTIDTFGRRNLLLTTFPLMAIFMLMIGFAFWIPGRDARVGVVSLGIYLFGMAYSPGEGPVPFTYSAEAYPLFVRDVGMSFSTSLLWFFNFIVAITFPRLLGAFKPQGAFGWYAAWNVIGFILVLLYVPETKALSLEELDQVFSVPSHVHAAYQLKALPHNVKKHIFRMSVGDLPPLYEHEGAIGEKTYSPGGSGPQAA